MRTGINTIQKPLQALSVTFGDSSPRGRAKLQLTEREKMRTGINTIQKPLQALSVTFGDSSPGGRAKSVGPVALSGPKNRTAAGRPAAVL